MSIRETNLAVYGNRFNAYTELRLQRNRSTQISLLNGDVVANTKTSDGGVSARVFKDGVWGFASRPQIDNDAVIATVDEATRNAAVLARHAARPEIVLPRAKTFKESDFGTQRPRLTQQQSIEFLQAIDAHIAKTYPDLKSRSVTRLDLDMEKHLYTADASEGYSNTTRSLIQVRMTTTNDAGQPVEYSKTFGGRGQFEDVFTSPDALFADIAEVHRHLMNKRHAVVPRAGLHDVVLDSDLAGILAHEAIGHTTEADIVQEGSVAGDYIGKLVASPLITLVDFANSYRGETLPVPIYIDDEGVESRDTILIENGVLKNFMHNKESSVLFGVPPTGNARAYTFSDEPLIRMRNTAILPGKDRQGDMIASIEDGYYLLRPSNGQADSTSEFMFGVTLGYEIKNGKLGRAITDTTISGVAFDLLKSVTMVSDEMSWTCAGMCGKKTLIPVGMGGRRSNAACTSEACDMIDRAFAQRSLDALLKRGFQKARVRLVDSDQHELQAEFGHTNLLRTTHNTELGLLGIVDDKQGNLTLNNVTDDGLAEAVDNLWSVANGSRADPANDIAQAQLKRAFTAGPAEPDVDRMYERVAEVLDYAKTRYPTLKMGSTAVSFGSRHALFLNSNGVDFDSKRSVYHASLMFTARDGTDVSSFNYTGATLADLDRPLASLGTTDALMRQTTEQVRTRKVPHKFTGDLIITPDSIGDFLGFLIGNIGNQPLISGTSLYKECLGKPVADSALTLHSRPRDLVGGYFVTGDGYEAQNATIVENGVLKSFLLDQYGSRKTGLARAVTGGGSWVIEAGSTPLDEMIADIKAGVLITRFSGGRPNDKGDFSGIAKNSYYIENGAIAYPISETMVSGNMASLLTSIVSISTERADYGSSLFPWVRVSGIGIS